MANTEAGVGPGTMNRSHAPDSLIHRVFTLPDALLMSMYVSVGLFQYTDVERAAPEATHVRVVHRKRKRRH